MSEVTGSAAWRELGADNVITRIKAVINNFRLSDNGEVAAITMGLPCYGESETGDLELQKAIREGFAPVPVYITNDVEVGWAGSLGLTPGINVVAGTGSIAFGKDESGATARCGGWSEFFSDEGSCYCIGRKSLQLFSKQADGRVPKDEFYTIFRKGLNLENDFDIIDIVHDEYIGSRDKVASLQLLTRDAALAGSLSARSLYKSAAEELCSLVLAIRNTLYFQKKPYMVSYSGGLYKTGDLILPYFFDGIEAYGGKPVSPKYEPMYGALLLAFEKCNPEGLPNLQNRLEIMRKK
jgi:N-acetylglucosamine kinase-like BadF-type ATPase